MHTQSPEIEKYMNQHIWVENTLQEAKEQVLFREASETPLPREKTKKRLREGDSLLVKTSSKIDFPPLDETWGTIVLSGLQNFKIDNITTDSPSSSITKEILATMPLKPESSTNRDNWIFSRYIKRLNRGMKPFMTISLLNSGSNLPPSSTGSFQPMTHKREECIWHSCRPRFHNQR